MFQQLQEQMQAAMSAIDAKLETMTIAEVGGDGLVKVTVSGKGRITAIEFDDAKVAPETSDVVADVLQTTINRALDAAEQAKANEVSQMTQGMMPGLQGLFGGG